MKRSIDYKIDLSTNDLEPDWRFRCWRDFVAVVLILDHWRVGVPKIQIQHLNNEEARHDPSFSQHSLCSCDEIGRVIKNPPRNNPRYHLTLKHSVYLFYFTGDMLCWISYLCAVFCHENGSNFHNDQLTTKRLVFQFPLCVTGLSCVPF